MVYGGASVQCMVGICGESWHLLAFIVHLKLQHMPAYIGLKFVTDTTGPDHYDSQNGQANDGS